MTKECFMTIRFDSKVVRRHFLNDIAEKVIATSEYKQDYFYENEVSYALPDQPYFDVDMPDVYWNFLTIGAANQVVNQGIADSGYGVDSPHYNRLLALKNTPESLPEDNGAIGAC